MPMENAVAEQGFRVIATVEYDHAILVYADILKLF
jgi:hypothetical protein